jgi:rRNA-processing protein FCF1/tRNA A-37 threonylcarbamoyl transferase component Bud32|tara:strand:+ start:130 stop:1731 length:1602 start_codon:yes stop_codon:yes gene_type:complete
MNNLPSLAKNYRIFIDTSSLMEPSAESFLLGTLIKQLEKNKNKIIVPFKVLKELQGLVKSNDPIKKFNARKGYSIFLKLEKLNCAIKMGEKGDGYVDNLFQVIFTKFRTKYKLCLITQDVGLAFDILDLNKSRSAEFNKSGKRIIKDIKAIKINGKDSCEEFSTQKKKPSIPKKGTVIKKTSAKPFKKSIKNIDITKSKVLATSITPDTNDIVITQQGVRLKLKEKIASGGEGIIYSVTNTEVCKIYKKEKVDELRIQKLKLMTSNQISYPRICWPKSIVYNINREPVGYLMNKADGNELQRTVFLPQLLKIHLSKWEKNDLVNVCIGILHKIIKLHQCNVVMGDINPMNILVTPNSDTFFVDTDSYQVEQYPCPVGQVNFTAPEIQGKNFKTFLRTVENENFAIATLLFMILLPGKPPYSHQGGTSPSANIKKRKFTYPFSYIDEKGNSVRDFNYEAPVGPWRLIWSNFPHFVQKAFYNTFKKGKRYTAHEWLDMMKNFKWYLGKKFTSNEIFPTEFKKVNDSTKQKYKKGD